MSLRLPFGVANGPNDHSIISEPVFDLTNNIMQDETYDPEEIHAPIQSQLSIPKDDGEEEDFAVARKLIVDVPYRDAVTDGYIDDAITVVVERENWVKKTVNVALLVVHALFRPVDENDPVSREEMVSMRKLAGEETPDKTKIILGWKVNTRRFRIYLW